MKKDVKFLRFALFFICISGLVAAKAGTAEKEAISGNLELLDAGEDDKNPCTHAGG